MSKESTAGLSIQDAWSEAEAEGTLSEEPSESADTTPAEPVEVSDNEQSAVETPEKVGLFNGLEGDNKSQVEQSSEEELHEVSTVNGVEEVTLEELKAGYMRKADYTKKRQEDSAKAEEADKALVLYNALQQNPMETVQRLWEKVRAGQPVQPDVNSTSDAPAEQSADIEQIVEERVQAILNDDPRLKSFQQQREMDRVDAVFKDIEDDWDLDEPISDEDKEFVINKAIEWDSADLEAVFAKLMHLRQKAQAEAENVSSNSTAKGYGGQQSVGLQKPTETKKFGSIRDAINETLADEGMNENDLQVAISAL